MKQTNGGTRFLCVVVGVFLTRIFEADKYCSLVSEDLELSSLVKLASVGLNSVNLASRKHGVSMSETYSPCKWLFFFRRASLCYLGLGSSTLLFYDLASWIGMVQSFLFL